MIRVGTHFILFCLLILLSGSPAKADELFVSAASSLTEAMRAIAREYRARYPDERILLNFAGSQALATQIEQGAPADLFISANQQAMKRLQRQELVDNPQPLLRNRLVLVARQNLQPALTKLNDLARPGLLLAVGNRQVPVGQYTRLLFDRLASVPEFGPVLIDKIKKNIVSEENRVKAIVAKLLLGEADAGIVYQSDLVAEGAKSLQKIPLPQQHNPLAVYPIAKVRGAGPNTDRFVAFLQSDRAQKIFYRFGFLLKGLS